MLILFSSTREDHEFVCLSHFFASLIQGFIFESGIERCFQPWDELLLYYFYHGFYNLPVEGGAAFLARRRFVPYTYKNKRRE